MIALSLAGWLVAAVASVAALALRRRLSARMEHVARSCHELRGPLTALGFGLALCARDGGLAPARLRAMEGELRRAALALDDLFGPAGGAAGCRSDGPVSVAALLDDVVAAAEGAAWSSGVRLSGRWHGRDAVVRGDRVRLAQALGNVVANAVEHGGGRVRVSGGLRGDDRVVIEVADDGPGLPAPLATLVRRPRAGRGIRGRGLAIAMAIARDHGGRLQTAPAVGGAGVVLTLPAVHVDVARGA